MNQFFRHLLLIVVVLLSISLAGCEGDAANQNPALPILGDAAFQMIDLVLNPEDIFTVANDSILITDDAVKLVTTIVANQTLPVNVEPGHVQVSLLYNKQGVESQDIYDVDTGKAGLGILFKGGDTFESFSGNSVDIDATHTSEVFIVPLQNATSAVKVSATKGWQNTGIFLKRGRSFQIRYSEGTWTSNKGTVGTSDASGRPVNTPPNLICNCGEPLPGYSTQALIGRIGTGSGFSPLQVGDNFSGVAYDNEFLYLRMNLPDNRLVQADGTITLSVQTNNS